MRTPVKEHTPEPSSPTLGQLLQSAPILGRKRERIELPEQPYVSKDVFQEDLAASFMNKRSTKVNDLNEMRVGNGVQYQFFHRITGKIANDEPIYTGCVNYKDMKEQGEMFNFAAHISIAKALKLYPIDALKSLTDEIDGMLSRKVWKGQLYGNLTEKQKKSVLYSSTIVKEKLDLDGKFIKIKSRMVTGGNHQDINDVPERLRSSPTTATSSVFTIASIAATKNMEVATIDVQQAYLNADMESDIFMWIPSPVSEILCERDPNFRPYMHSNGNVLVKLMKAQYGCIESAKLWYNHISRTLTEQGFSKNPLDQCVFQREETNNEWTYVTVYVDDLMIVSDKKEYVDTVIEKIKEKYMDITIKRGKIHDYLGMRFDFSNHNEVFISMSTYTNEICKEYGIEGKAETPAANDLFEIDDESPKLGNKERERFHRTVAQCLYAVSRTRPDASLAVIFLTTRVLDPTEQDTKKLERLLRYFNDTETIGLFLGMNENNEHRLICYADASHGVHFNGKSHTGIVITHGRGAIVAKSAKQKIVCRSSTESELVALSDATSLTYYELQFLQSLGIQVDFAKMYQDNTSTITMAKNGKSCSDRTKHIKLRYFFVKQFIESGEFSVTHCPTEMMTADVLTKPLQGKLFKEMRNRLLGYV